MLKKDKFIMINPLKLQGAIEVDEEVNGVSEKGVFIPYGDYMRQFGKTYFICLDMDRLEFKEKNKTHVLFQHIGNGSYKVLKELGLNRMALKCGSVLENIF